MDVAAVLRALGFAAERHRTQRRKDPADTPFINHLIDVAEILAGPGRITDVPLLQAAILHDTLEDTETTAQEIEDPFGQHVRHIVEELTENRELRRAERKQDLVDRAPKMTIEARQVKIADMIANLRSLRLGSSPDWPLRFRREYADFTEQVFQGCRGLNPHLDALFEQTLAEAREKGL